MRYFRVLEGSHFDGDVEYKAKSKKSIVPSNRPLDAIFPNKFMEVDQRGRPLMTPEEEAEVVALAEQQEEEDENALVHRPNPKARASANDEEEEDEPVAPRASKKKPAPKAKEEPKESPFGIDVTEAFAEASAAELQVFRKGNHYHVVDPDIPDSALNETGLTKVKVGSFIKKLTKATK